jgi:serine/threonine protein kinase
LEAAHQEGIVHRDLKPSNLRVRPDLRLKILDFDLAMLLPHGEPSEETVSLRDTSLGVGTLPYMAPEQLRGETVEGRTDIWAAGVFDRAAELGIDLMLAGHTHGGQLALETVHRGFNLSRLLYRYTGGWYENRGTKLYVNRGIGTTGFLIRLGAPVGDYSA